MTSQTGNDVTSRFVDHGFLFVFNTQNVCKMHRLNVLFVFFRHLPSILYRFDAISAFLSAENGRKTISAARGRSRPELSLPFDSLTPIWYRSVLEFCV
jgi:hypothetical protein